MIPISIIVPIYNMEKLMRKCLDSILTQTFHDYECLLIDDGSTDGSPAICDEYAAKDSRFTAYHKPNGGLSDARNFGLERAQGEYTIFFDPDDWVGDTCLEEMFTEAEKQNADMVMCDIYYNDAYREQYSKQEPHALDHYSVLEDIVADKVQGFTVIKLIRRDLYQRYNIKYPVGMYGCEDQYTICHMLKNDIKIAYLPKAFYHYMHYGNDSLSRHYDEKTYKHDLMIRNMFCELLKDTPCPELVYECKTKWLFYRAFMYGRNEFSSRRFKETFSDCKGIGASASPAYMKLFYRLAFAGYYQTSRKLYGVLYEGKQLYKRIRHSVQ